MLPWMSEFAASTHATKRPDGPQAPSDPRTSAAQRWLHWILGLLFVVFGVWAYSENQAIGELATSAPREAARRLLGLAEVLNGGILAVCALLALSLFQEGLARWRQATAASRRGAWLRFGLALVLLIVGWSIGQTLRAKLEDRLAPVLAPAPGGGEEA
jgi:hypothetical protein